MASVATSKPARKTWAIILAVALALSLVAAPLGYYFKTKAAESKAAYSYVLTGNSGAVITGSGSISNASVDDESLATVSVDGNTVTVTGVDGAVGLAKVTVDGTLMEVPIGYTTFIYDGDGVTVYEGSDTKYEVYGQTTADAEEHELTAVENEDGSLTYTNDGDVKTNVNIKKKGGTYVFSGTGTDGSISVNKAASADAYILLAGLDLTSSYTSPITVKKESEATAYVKALAGTVNTLTDAELNNADTYGDEEDGGDGTNAEYAESAVIKAKSYANLVLTGEGTLNLKANAKNAVKVGDYGSLIVKNLTLNVESVKHGLSSNNTLTVKSGTLNITADQDGIRADPDEVDADAGCAGIVEILGGTITLDVGDDGVHAEAGLICGEKDASDDNLNVTIKNSYEGLEGATVTIYSGTYDITASDDGINSADGSQAEEGQPGEGGQGGPQGQDGQNQDGQNQDGQTPPEMPSGEQGQGGPGGQAPGGQQGQQSGSLDENELPVISDGQTPPELPDGEQGQAPSDGQAPDGQQGQQPGQGGGFNSGAANDNGLDMTIAGGNVTVNAGGDGLDCNGNMTLSGGTIVVWSKPAGGDDQPLDCDGSITIKGATVFAAGGSGMGTVISSDSQNYITSGSTVVEGKTITVKNGDTTVYETKALKNANYILYSSPDMTSTDGWSIVADNSDITGGGDNQGPGGNGQQPGGDNQKPDDSKGDTPDGQDKPDSSDTNKDGTDTKPDDQKSDDSKQDDSKKDDQKSDDSKSEDPKSSYTGIKKTTYNGETAWWRVVNDEVDATANGVYKNEYGWWFVKDGKVDFSYTGIAKNEYGWWRVENGKVNFGATGIYKNEYGWWRVENGKVNFKADGIYKNEYGWWKTTNGKVTFKESGVYKNDYGWWKVNGSKVDFSFTGIAKNDYGTWYVKNGKVDFTKNGKVIYNGKTYTVTNGKAKAA